MTPRQADAATRTATDLFRERLDNMLNQRHALYRLADLIEWSVFDNEFGSLYCPDNGCPGKPTRLMVGLQYLKHCYGLSDEAVVSGWVENPYWQYFCGEVYISGQKRGIKTQRLKRSLKRRQAIEPVIGHLKADGLLGRNHLKGTQGDQLNVLLSCAGHNLRLILRRLRLFCLEKRILILAWLRLLVPAARLSGVGTQLNRKLACLAPLPAPIIAT